MQYLFQQNGNMMYAYNPYVEKNTFLTQPVQTDELPKYEQIKDQLPKPVWDGHEDAIRCYNKVWELAFGNLRKAKAEAGFVPNFIDTAFNGNLFMWDSTFIVMFGKYASRIFDFQRTLDNFYSHQHKDGFICREICEDARGEQWSRDDPASTGPNVLPWAEWEYFKSTGDMERLARVFDPLCGYHRWMQLNRSWPDGSYFSCGYACGMDNQPRQAPGYDECVSHGFMSWIDACAQQYLSAEILVNMAKVLDREDEVQWLKEEAAMLKDIVNKKMWDEETAFYYDTRRDGRISGVKTIGAYWTLLANLVPDERKDAFVAHLDNEKEFKRTNRVPTLSADDPHYVPAGGYWLGSVWAPTNYMVLCGLTEHGYHQLAYEIADCFVKIVVSVFEESGTVYENYAPEAVARGNASLADFVGWTGLAPISILFEHVFGILPDAQNHHITWRVNRTERHGIMQYPLGNATIDLICEARSDANEEPNVRIVSDVPVTVDIIWGDRKKTIQA